MSLWNSVVSPQLRVLSCEISLVLIPDETIVEWNLGTRLNSRVHFSIKPHQARLRTHRCLDMMNAADIYTPCVWGGAGAGQGVESGTGNGGEVINGNISAAILHWMETS